MKSPSQKGVMRSNQTSCHGRKDTLIIMTVLRSFIDIYKVGKEKRYFRTFFPELKFLAKI